MNFTSIGSKRFSFTNGLEKDQITLPDWEESVQLKKGELVCHKINPKTLYFQTKDAKESQCRRIGEIIQGINSLESIKKKDKILNCGFILQN